MMMIVNDYGCRIAVVGGVDVVDEWSFRWWIVMNDLVVVVLYFVVAVVVFGHFCICVHW